MALYECLTCGFLCTNCLAWLPCVPPLCRGKGWAGAMSSVASTSVPSEAGAEPSDTGDSFDGGSDEDVDMVHRKCTFVRLDSALRQGAAKGIKAVLFDKAGPSDETVFWELRHTVEPFLAPCGSSDADTSSSSSASTPFFHRWWKKLRAVGLKERMYSIGLSYDHVRPSLKHAKALGLPSDHKQWLASEALGSTHAVLVALCYLSVSATANHNRAQALNILADFVVATVDLEEFETDHGFFFVDGGTASYYLLPTTY